MVDQAPPKATTTEIGRSAGRGVLLITFAKFYFMIAGFVVAARLPALLGRTAFGAFGVVNAFVSPVNNVMVTGTIQAVARFIARDETRTRMVQATGMRMHLYVGLGVAAAFAALAPLIAWFQHDTAKTPALMLGALVIAGYSFYAVNVGTANGQRWFAKQAGLDITFATLRVAGLLGAAAMGLGVLGVFSGWILAVALILLISGWLVGGPRGAKAEPSRPMARYFAELAAFLVLFNMLMFADTWMLKRISTDYFLTQVDAYKTFIDSLLPSLRPLTGYTPRAEAMADGQVAYYTAVQNLARLSYQAIIAVTFVVFPLVSQSTFAQDQATTRRYVQITMRYSLIFAMAIATTMAAMPEAVLGLVYPADYARIGAPALIALALGNVAFSMFAIACTILNGAGKTKATILISAITLALAVAACWAILPQATHQGETAVLLLAASCTGGAMLIGALLAGFMLRRELGGFLQLPSVARILLAAGVAVLAGRALPQVGKLLTLLEVALVGCVFIVTLVVTRELGRSELALIAQVRKHRGQGEP